MTLDQAIERLEMVRQFYGGERQVGILSEAEPTADGLGIVLRERMTQARDRRQETMITMPHAKEEECAA